MGSGTTGGKTYLSLIPNPNNKDKPNYNIKIVGDDVNGDCKYETVNTTVVVLMVVPSPSIPVLLNLFSTRESQLSDIQVGQLLQSW